MDWITRKEYCERQSIKLRTFQYRKKSGLIQWRYGASGRGGEAGKHIEVGIDDEQITQSAERMAQSEIPKQVRDDEPNKDRYRVKRGEPGCNIVTPFENGESILTDGGTRRNGDAKITLHGSMMLTKEHKIGDFVNLSKIPTGCPRGMGISDPTIRANRVCDPPSPEREEGRECVASTVPAPDHIQSKVQDSGDPLGQCAPATQRNLPSILDSPPLAGNDNRNPKLERKGYLIFALLNAVREEISKNHKPKGRVIKEILEMYNSGFFLPEIFKEIGPRQKSTISNWDRLDREGGIKALIPQYRGPDASPITENERNIFLNCLLHQNQLKIGSAIKFTKTFLAYKKMPSPSSEYKFRNFAEDFKCTHHDLWIMAREGDKALNDKCFPYAERNWRFLTVGEGLVADGHRLNFQVINPFTGKPCRATIVLFWDWKSSYPLGWEIMLEENVQCIASALRNAILTLGKIPKWLLIDNGKAFKAKAFTSEMELEDGILYGMFATLGIHTHFSQAYNAQEKPLERFWGTFNNWFERLLPSYTGASINDKPPYMLRNEKDAQARHNKWVPKIEEINDLLFKFRKFYADQPSRGRAGKTPGELFEAEKGPGVDPAELYHLMMVKEMKMVHRQGITWNGWHYYHKALYGMRDYVLVKYSHSDYSQLHCFYKGRFLCTATPIDQTHPMASEAEFPKDHEAHKRVSALKSRLKRSTKNLLTLIESGAPIDVERDFRRTPDVADVIKVIQEKTKPDTPGLPYVKESDQEAPAISSGEEKPIRFDDGAWQRYEFHLKGGVYNGPELDKKFIEDYKAGKIAPGEYESIYGEKRLDREKEDRKSERSQKEGN